MGNYGEGGTGAVLTTVLNFLLQRSADNRRWKREAEAQRERWEHEDEVQQQRWNREDKVRYHLERVRLYTEFNKVASAIVTDAYEDVL